MSTTDSFKTFIAGYRWAVGLVRSTEAAANRTEGVYQRWVGIAYSKLGVAGEESTWLKPWTAFVIFYLLLLTRSWHWIVHPQFYIEDGPEFYGIAFNSPYPVHALQTVGRIYMGYYHLVPRLIALICSLFPPRFGPLLMEIFSLGIQALAGAVFVSSRLRRQISSVGNRGLCGVLVVGYPYSNELFANVAHSQWYLALIGVVLLCAEPGETKFSRVCDCVLVFLIAFTGPFSLILAPLGWFLAKRDPHRRLLAEILSVAAAVTVFSMFTHPRFGVHGKPRFSLFARMLSNQVVIGSTLGLNRVRDVPFEPMFNWPELFYAVFCTGIVVFAILRGPNWVRALAGVGLFTFVTSLYAGGNWVMLGNGGVAERYFFYLGLLFVFGCCMAANCAPSASLRWGFRALVLSTTLGMVCNWIYAPPFDTFDYGRQIAAYSGLRRGESLDIKMPIDRKVPTSHWDVTLIKR